jgi:hypothetical protein
MSELFGKEATSHMMSRNVMKEDFGWEIPVESVPIPSRGIIYSPDTVMYKKDMVKIKAMTAREEDILASQAYIKEGTVIDNLMKSCIMEQGFDSEQLILGDRNALLVAIRITGYGSDYNLNVRCNNCSEYNDIVVDLGSLEIKRLSIKPVAEGNNLFEFTLPVTKKKVQFKFSTAVDEKDKRHKKESFKKHSLGPISGDVTTALEYAIMTVDTVTDKNKIKHFVMNMPALDAKRLRDFMRKNEPGMKMESEFNCKHCAFHNEFAIPITTEFFWPTT